MSRPKATRSDEQGRHDVRALEQVDRDRREQEADRATGGTHGLRVLVAVARDAVREVHEAQDAAADRDPADDLATRRAVEVGVAQRPPGDDEQQDRHRHGEDADGAGRRSANRAADRAGDVAPDGGGNDDREAEDAEADAVTALLGIEVLRAVTDAAGDRAHQPGEAEPHGCRRTQERVEDSSNRTRSRASSRWSAGCRLAGLRLALLWRASCGPGCRTAACAAGKTFGSPWSKGKARVEGFCGRLASKSV